MNNLSDAQLLVKTVSTLSQIRHHDAAPNLDLLREEAAQRAAASKLLKEYVTEIQKRGIPYEELKLAGLTHLYYNAQSGRRRRS